MNSLILHAAEVRRALEQGTVLVVRPISEQPDGAARFSGCDEPEPYVMKGGHAVPWKPGKCPFGGPGSTRWVRETWKARLTKTGIRPGVMVFYKATLGSFQGLVFEDDILPPDRQLSLSWRSPVGMPRWATRQDITLKLLDVRAKLVQGISEEDAIATGIQYQTTDGAGQKWYGAGHEVCPRSSAVGPVPVFGALWDARYAKRKDKQSNRSYARTDNPMVWLGKFEVVKPKPKPTR